MNVFPALAAILALAATPALAQTSPTPGSLGGDQVGTGAVEAPANTGGSGSASASTAITSTPPTGTTATSPATGAAAAAGSGSTGTGSPSGGSGGGGRGGGMEALCLSAEGSVTSVNPDEFGLDCPE
jgi:hypothetical protein